MAVTLTRFALPSRSTSSPWSGMRLAGVVIGVFDGDGEPAGLVTSSLELRKRALTRLPRGR